MIFASMDDSPEHQDLHLFRDDKRRPGAYIRRQRTKVGCFRLIRNRGKALASPCGQFTARGTALGSIFIFRNPARPAVSQSRQHARPTHSPHFDHVACCAGPCSELRMAVHDRANRFEQPVDLPAIGGQFAGNWLLPKSIANSLLPIRPSPSAAQDPRPTTAVQFLEYGCCRSWGGIALNPGIHGHFDERRTRVARPPSRVGF